MCALTCIKPYIHKIHSYTQKNTQHKLTYCPIFSTVLPALVKGIVDPSGYFPSPKRCELKQNGPATVTGVVDKSWNEALRLGSFCGNSAVPQAKARKFALTDVSIAELVYCDVVSGYPVNGSFSVGHIDDPDRICMVDTASTCMALLYMQSHRHTCRTGVNTAVTLTLAPTFVTSPWPPYVVLWFWNVHLGLCVYVCVCVHVLLCGEVAMGCACKGMCARMCFYVCVCV